jgi:hypothetical protein
MRDVYVLQYSEEVIRKVQFAGDTCLMALVGKREEFALEGQSVGFPDG